MLLVKFLNKIFKTGGFVLEDANGISYNVGEIKLSEKPLTIKLLDKKLHYQLIYHPQWFFPLGYEEGKIEIKNGTISDVMDLFFKNTGKDTKIGEISNFFAKINTYWSNLAEVATIKKSKSQIQAHYDVNSHEEGNFLYEQFLDSNLVYSCGYWLPGDDLKTAQERKIKLILDKLKISENERVLEIGSGWGHATLTAAKLTKAECLGITLSKNQLEYSRKKARELNLHNQVRFELMDWRELKEKVDVCFSIGSAEHWQIKKNGLKFFRKLYSILADKTGRACIHSIFSSIPIEERTKNKYIQKKIFRGGEIPDLKSFIKPIEQVGFELINMQIIRSAEGYPKTLSAWISNLRKNKDKIIKKFGINLYRCYEVYLAGSKSSFEPYSDQNVVQLLIAKQKDALPPINFSYH